MRYLCCSLVAAAFLASPAHAGIAGVVFFTDPGLFAQNNALFNKVPKSIETFEESDALNGSKTPFPNPLQNGTPRPGFPNGINAPNLIIQTNITQGPSPATTNPSANPNALWVNGSNFIGSNSIKVGTDEFLNGLFSSIDLIFTTDDKTAIGLDVSTFAGFDQGNAGFIFTAYDLADNFLGSFFMPGPVLPEPSKNFIGVWSPIPIGRVNVWGIFSIPQPFAVDNIEMWVPSPGAGALAGLGALGLGARRRRR